MDCRASLAMTQSDAGAKPREGCDSVAREIADQVRDEGRGGSVPLRMEVDTRDIVCGYAYVSLGRVRGPGQNGRGGRPRDELNA